MSNQRAFITGLRDYISLLGLTEKHITKDLVRAFGGTYLLQQYKSLSSLLKTFGLYTTRETKVFKSQQILLAIVKKIFAPLRVDVHYNYRHHDLRFIKSF